MQNVGLVVVVGDIQSIASGIYIPISLCWSGFPLNRKVRRWAVVVSLFCAGWQRWHSTTVNHAESCWRQLWCFYQRESYLWYWLKIMIKYESRHQVSIWVTSWALELQTKAIQRFPKISHSWRRPLLGPSPGWKHLLALSHLRHY